MKHNIGIFNNNWKSGHRRDEAPFVEPDTKRLLEIYVDACKMAIDGAHVPGMETFRANMFEKMLDAYEQINILESITEEAKSMYFNFPLFTRRVNYQTNGTIRYPRPPADEIDIAACQNEGCGNDDDLYQFATGR